MEGRGGLGWTIIYEAYEVYEAYKGGTTLLVTFTTDSFVGYIT